MQSLRPDRGSVAAIGLMILGVLALYCPLQLLDGESTLLGFDYAQIHGFRIRYAQEALLGTEPHLPAWYTRELMGTPFWSNIQSFPFLPTRLALLWVDAGILYAVAVNVAAVLAALFTCLYCRQLQLGRVASAAAGWTYAASGYFASRVLVGHLPLLEAFGALPLLLWCLESMARSDPASRRHWLRHVGLALAVLCVALAGHPQVPAYALGTAALYAVVRMRGRRGLQALLTMALGVGLGAFAWWPMLGLIGRSTRILALDRAENDVPFPYGRLKAFVLPWADGWPHAIERLPAQAFVDTRIALFWDTVCYVGWLPLVAALVLVVRRIGQRRLPAMPWLFLALVGIAAVLFALPFAQALVSGTQLTIVRSPSRQLCLTTFALAAATGVFIDALLRTRIGRSRVIAPALVGVLLVAHAVDLSIHDRHFITPVARPPAAPERIEAWRRESADRRVAIDLVLPEPVSRQVDDVGVFDSIVLARPYRAFVAMTGASERLNLQNLNGSDLPTKALAALAVKWVVTTRQREKGSTLAEGEIAQLYAVPDPARRATFVPDSFVDFLEERDALDRFRRGDFDYHRIALPPAARPTGFRPELPAAPDEPAVQYSRPDSDHILIQVGSRGSGYLRVMESWDEGWSATIDGEPTELLLADTFAMAVRLLPGDHDVRMTYRTPGARTGMVITFSSMIALVIALRRRRGEERIVSARR